jgi:hypothetical protein
VDLASIPDDESFPSILAEALALRVGDGPTATVYTYFGPSINFHEQTASAFVLVAGPERVLKAIHQAFVGIAGVRVRFSDYVRPAEAVPQAHIQEGTLWRPLDVENWYSDVEQLVVADDVTDVGFDDEDIEFDDTECEDEEDSAGSTVRKATPRRVRAARADASIGSIIRSIERIFSLPEGSVALCGPDKRVLRRDAKIATLRRRWE